jgi:hypothetical protein
LTYTDILNKNKTTLFAPWYCLVRVKQKREALGGDTKGGEFKSISEVGGQVIQGIT